MPTVAKAHGRLSLGLDQTLTDRVSHELDAVAHAELLQHPGAVRFDGLFGEMEDLGDLLVRVRLSDQLHNLLLARRESPGLLAALQEVPNERLLGGGGEERLAAARGSYGIDEVLVGGPLQDVSGGAGTEGLEEVSLVVVHREDQDLRI